MSAATQNEMERLRAERDALQQLNAALEREVAMADRCPEGWQCVPKTVTPEMAEAYASDAYDTAQQCHDAVLGAAPNPSDADEAINSNPAASLARRDLINQAEVLRDVLSFMASEIGPKPELEELFNGIKGRAEQLEKRAQELTP